ncbi:MAG TPA: CHRD domain-containing protein [Mucilaginibacter sp.]
MKHLLKKISISSIIGLLLGLTVLGSCTKGKQLVSVKGAVYTVSGNSDGSQMVPASSTAATGSFDGWYDEQLNVLTFTLTWTNIGTTAAKDPITAINFYAPAGNGAAGTLIHTIQFSNNNVSGSVVMALSGYNELLPAERSALYAGQAYYVICTVSAPNGLIRGQLAAVKR